MSAMVQQPRSEGTYTFASQPRVVSQRKKFRDPVSAIEHTNSTGYGNIMYDRRVIRGSTYAQRVLPASAGPDPVELQREQEARRHVTAKRRAQQQMRIRTPEAVEGRQHVDVQTELYLEELTDRVEEADVECQTDAFLDRPPSPMFVPAKTGVDCETQILDGELFDFSMEVKPVLEVLVGKTVEQSLLEVMEEEELSNLREQQRQFQELRNAELVEQQRLEEEDRRRRAEKERRIQQQAQATQKEAETSEKIAARAFAQSYLADLVPSVFGLLSQNGYFFDPVERGVEKDFMPWLMDSVDAQLNLTVVSRRLIDTIINEVVRNRVDQYSQLQASLPDEPVQTEPVVEITTGDNEDQQRVQVTDAEEENEETHDADDNEDVADDDHETAAAADADELEHETEDDDHDN